MEFQRPNKGILIISFYSIINHNYKFLQIRSQSSISNLDINYADYFSSNTMTLHHSNIMILIICFMIHQLTQQKSVN